MKERPILFSGPMVRAILDGRKTQTRRIIRINPYDGAFYLYGGWPHRSKDGETPRTDGKEEPYNCPYGVPGDRLWVRETWRPFSIPSVNGDAIAIRYAANDTLLRIGRGDTRLDGWTMPQAAVKGGFVPSIHMPRWASRIDLEIVSVRVERLQDISEADARAEGPPRNWADGLPGWTAEDAGWLTPVGWENAERGEDCDDAGLVGGEPAFVFSAREALALWWDHINGDCATWESNPWVWVVEFRRVRP